MKRSKSARQGWKTRRANERARSRAAVRGWETRKKNERQRERERHRKRIEPPKAPPKPPERRGGGIASRDHILTFSFTSKGRSYRRDLVVPAAPGTSTADLVRMARRDLPRYAEPMKQFITARNVEAIEGPTTRRKRTELR